MLSVRAQNQAGRARTHLEGLHNARLKRLAPVLNRLLLSGTQREQIPSLSPDYPDFLTLEVDI